MTKFSIIIPVYNRQDKLLRALTSLENQTYTDFEVIVVDDHSETLMDLGRFEGDPRFWLMRLKEHSERVIARTAGWQLAEGEWICNLDSDDQYAPHYLETIVRAEQEHPGARCFNFGAVVHWKNNTTLRQAFKPAWMNGSHVEFKSGHIGQGSFVVREDALDEIPLLPQVKSPYKFHELATDVHHLYPYPGLSLGNPWGDDWLLFFRITRKIQSIPLDNCLYTQFVRGHL